MGVGVRRELVDGMYAWLAVPYLVVSRLTNEFIEKTMIKYEKKQVLKQ
jgi:hypothetical protein